MNIVRQLSYHGKSWFLVMYFYKLVTLLVIMCGRFDSKLTILSGLQCKNDRDGFLCIYNVFSMTGIYSDLLPRVQTLRCRTAQYNKHFLYRKNGSQWSYSVIHTRYLTHSRTRVFVYNISVKEDNSLIYSTDIFYPVWSVIAITGSPR